MPVGTAEFATYGGDTTCYSLHHDDGSVIAIIDAGTGLRRILPDTMTAQPSDDPITIIITHYHWDHIQGLSMCAPMWRRDLSLRLIGPGDPRTAIGEAISPPWFPASITDVAVEFVQAPDEFMLGDVRARSFPLHHPQGGRGYRFDHQDTSIVVATDHEAGTEADDMLVEMSRGAGVLVHDTQYRPSEIAAKHGWGHSTWQQAVEIASRADVQQLLFASHDPARTDAEIEEMVEQAMTRFPNTIAARPGSRFWAK
ncbi:MAG TPA: MBL fold metallo-hydrolase [Nitriliruptoraceae bacterium]|nr:MBL fold metallo-hydrolase [Nitriliruptoraceae bacterium]